MPTPQTSFQRFQVLPSASLEGMREDLLYVKAMAEAANDLAEGLEEDLEVLAETAAAEAIEGRGFFWRGPWADVTAYVVDDVVTYNGSSYRCKLAHTSATADDRPETGTDWADAWDLFVAKGAAGAGTGDMLGSNNLSDVADPATARSNISAAAASHTHDDRYYTESEITAFLADKAATARQVAAGTGLTGGGDLSDDRTIAADIASQPEAESGTSSTKLMTPQRSRQHGDARYAMKSRSIGAGNGLSGGGTLEVDRTLALNYPNQAEAEAGVENTKAMTSLRVAQAIAAQASPGVSQQTFNASGTWTKPASGTMALIELWGAGGSGARHTTSGQAQGAGGGAYISMFIPLALLGATESVVVGAGGAPRSGSNQSGADGGNTTFGDWLTAYGGKAGLASAVGEDVSWGGGPLGSSPATSTPAPPIGLLEATPGASTIDALPWFHGGRGGKTGPGQDSLFGGAGGGAATGNHPGGQSKLGGDGGQGGSTGADGQAPGGGGGAGTSVSGAGAPGRARITIF